MSGSRCKQEWSLLWLLVLWRSEEGGGMTVGSPSSGQLVRLHRGRGPWEGHLQIRHENVWRGLDARSWHPLTGHLACSHLGYARAVAASSLVPGGQPEPPLKMRCPPEGKSLKECSVFPCEFCKPSDAVVTIRCERDSVSRCPPHALETLGGRRWERWGHWCYALLDNYRASRETAKDLCRRSGAELTSVTSQAEHEFISELASHSLTDLEYNTDGTSLPAEGRNLWLWESPQQNMTYAKWWTGWNQSQHPQDVGPPASPSGELSCLVLKRSFPLNQYSASEYDSGFFFFHGGDCSLPRPFICKAPLRDVGCRHDSGTSYSGTANISRSGLPCLKWTDPRINSLDGRSGHARSTFPFDMTLIGNNNFCRNPNGAAEPWCFVGADMIEGCDVPLCDPQELPERSSPASVPRGTTPRPSTLLNPIALERTEEANLLTTHFATTPPPLHSTTLKVRCHSDEYQCESRNVCIGARFLCDGKRHCDLGDDERSCKRFLQDFRVKDTMSLILQSPLNSVSTSDRGVCAKTCLDLAICKGFVYNENKRECLLSRVDVPSSGLRHSQGETFYELTARRSSCSGLHRCYNEKCVPKDDLCNGVDDCGDRSDEADCSRMKYETRLVGGGGPYEGNIMVKVQDQWGYICDDSFGWKEADKLCQDLGFPDALSFTRNNHFGNNTPEWRRSNVVFWFDQLSCKGPEESIYDCSSKGVGFHDCGPTEIAGVVCRHKGAVCGSNQFQCGPGGRHQCLPREKVCDGSPHCTDQSDESPSLCDDVGVVRLELPQKESELRGSVAGTVHVKHRGSWGTVCDDGFDAHHAQVICRSLGFENGWAVPYTRARFGSGTGEIWVDEPSCTGEEAWVGQCPKVNWGVSDCEHSEDAGVLCSDEPEIRLVGGPNSQSGRVEIKLSNVWGTICDDDFDDYDAIVVCRMLGHRNGGIAHKGAYYGRGSGPVWLSALDCSHKDVSVRSCLKESPAQSACSHGEDASVTCYSSRNERMALDKTLRMDLPGFCGEPPTSVTSFLTTNFAKIIGGRRQTPQDAPWLVSLILKERGSLKHNCGGVVINEDYVMTAAHCFKNYGKNNYIVRVGEYDIASADAAQEDFVIDKLWVHDDFDQTVEFNNDIALIRVMKKHGKGITFSKHVQPVCLPTEETDYSRLAECSIMGWGTTSEWAKPVPEPKPRIGSVKLYPMSVCTAPGGYKKAEVTTGMFCAGRLDGQVDTCTGDSGGPLTCKVGTKTILYGITSWGKGCGRRGQPGMYTRITKYLRWIHYTIGK